MNAMEPLGESEGACTGGNFPACSLRVKQHGAILGMQMHDNGFRRDSGMVRRTRPQMCNCTSGNLAANRDSGLDARRIAPE